MTYSTTTSETFTIINARKLSAKVAADMHLCAQFYAEPSETWIRQYAEELAQHLGKAYVSEYEFGFAKNGKRVLSWRYKVDEDGQLTSDDRAGHVVAHVNTAGASFFNFLTQSSRFLQLSASQQEAFCATLPFRRVSGDPPSDGLGYWTSDRNYFSGGRALNRQTFQPLS